MTLKNHILRLYAAPLLALLFIMSACQSEEVLPGAEDYPMTFGSNVSTTRAMIESLTDLQGLSAGFGVYGSKTDNLGESNQTMVDLFTNQLVKYNSDSKATDTKWEYSPIKYWDKTASAYYDFCAYAPRKTSDVSCTNHVISVSGIPQWQDYGEGITPEQRNAIYDFMVADNRTGKYSSFDNGIVNFVFKHKLAKLIVSITQETATASTSSNTYKVTSFALGGNGESYTNNSNSNPSLTADQNAKVPLEQNRTYSRNYLLPDNVDNFDTDWTKPEGAAGQITLYSNSTGKVVAESPNYTTVLTCLVAPFDLAEGKTIPITVGYTSGGTTNTAIPTATTLTGFKPGMTYNIRLKIGAAEVKAEVVEIQEWTEGGSADNNVYNW